MTEMFDVLPLSPVREWANARSFIGSGLENRKLRLRGIFREQRRGDRDYLARRFPGAATAGRPIGVERLDLVADARRFRQGIGAADDADAHLVRLCAL